MAVAFTLMEGKCSTSSAAYKYSDTIIAESSTAEVIYSSEIEQTTSESEQGANQYHRLPLAEYSNINVYDDYCLEYKDRKYGDDVGSLST